METLILLFVGNLSLSIIFVAVWLLMVLYIVKRPGNKKVLRNISFDLWFALMSMTFLGTVILFCANVLDMH